MIRDIAFFSSLLEAADYYEVHMLKNHTTSLLYANGVVEHLQTSTKRSGNIRVLYKGGWGFVSFNGENYPLYARQAFESAKLAAQFQKDPFKIV
ncbi:MAG: PmbA/TldA family metallopeptidase, partial [Brevinematales bacterium]